MYPSFQSRRIQSTSFLSNTLLGIDASSCHKPSNTLLWKSQPKILEYSASERSNTLLWNARILCFGTQLREAMASAAKCLKISFNALLSAHNSLQSQLQRTCTDPSNSIAVPLENERKLVQSQIIEITMKQFVHVQELSSAKPLASATKCLKTFMNALLSAHNSLQSKLL